MPDSNETPALVCKFLDASDFENAHRIFGQAFSDYIVPFQLTEEQFRIHIVLNAVDLSRSMACFDNGHLVGFSLNGFGKWNGIPTVYDAGTGVISSHRKRGISESMFRKMLSIFRDEGYKQCLLEVIRQNEPAVRLYEKLGFERTRDLYLMQATELRAVTKIPDGIEIREIAKPDPAILYSFGEGRPSWQNTAEAIERSLSVKQIMGAFDSEICVGFVAFNTRVGRVAQIAVKPGYRRRGIGSNLLAAMEAVTLPGNKLQVINIDAELTGSVEFFRSCGFEVILEQFEMLKKL